MIRACLIGAGRMGSDHANHIARAIDGQLYCVVDASESMARTVAERHGAIAYTSVEEALADPKVDAVVIATPTDTHAELIIAAARAGKPICCEKPIDLSIERIDTCLQAVEEAGVPFFVAFNRRFDPTFEALQQRVHEGAVGTIEQVTINSRDWQLPSTQYLRSSGLLFRDMTIHDFDMARWILGEEPVEVYATGSCLVDPTIASFGDVDTASTTLKTARGAIVQIINSRRSVWGYDQRIEVSGPKGLIRADNIAPTGVVQCTASGVTGDCPPPSFPQRHAVGYQREIDHFFTDVVKGRQPPRVGGRDGRQAIVIADAATLSLQENRPVTIPAPEAATPALA